MPRPEYFTLDPLAMNLRELVRCFGKGWHLLILLLLKLFRRISPWTPDSAFRMPREFSNIELTEAKIPENFRLAIRIATKELTDLGFHEVAFHGSYDEVPKTSVYACNLLSSDGRSYATVHAYLNHATPSAKVTACTTILGITAEKELVGFPNEEPSTDPRPGTRVVPGTGKSPTELWNGFQSKFADTELRRFDKNMLKHQILLQLQEQIRHLIVRGIYRLVTDQELAALGRKHDDPEAPPPLPGQLPGGRAVRRTRAKELRPPSVRQRLDYITKFACSAGLWVFLHQVQHDTSYQKKPGELTLIFVLMLLTGLAWGGFLFLILCDMPRAYLIGRAYFSRMKPRLREPPVKLREPKLASSRQIVLQGVLSVAFWSLLIYSILCY